MCLTPINLKDRSHPVPCGRCPECRKRRAAGWAFRLQQQLLDSITANFITLTYETAHVPISNSKRLSLCKSHCQSFFKRLREAHPVDYLRETPIKYYLAGEYGTNTWRPHYHVILFNSKLELIQPSWKYGQIHYDTVNSATIAYTLKYICKPKRVPQYQADDRVPEFSLMSKNLA
ncbi:MAG: replication initiator protein [Microviridae sp.]|nr:MAG: replication initiator protein [Microviridae sp.]